MRKPNDGKEVYLLREGEVNAMIDDGQKRRETDTNSASSGKELIVALALLTKEAIL